MDQSNISELNILQPIDRDEELSQSVSSASPCSALSPKQLLALEALCNLQPKETFSNVADKAGINRRTLYRYLQSKVFRLALQSRMEGTAAAYGPGIFMTLCRAALDGDMAAQRIYWQLGGKLQGSIEIVADKREETATIDVNNFPVEFREELLRQVKGIKAAGNSDASDAVNMENMDNVAGINLDYIDVKASNPTTNPSDNLSDNLDLFTIDAIELQELQESKGPNDPVNEPVNGNGHGNNGHGNNKPLSVAELLSKL